MARLTRALVAIFVLAGCVIAFAPAASAERRAEINASVQLFYDDLSPYGRWVVIPVYGTVWVPASGRPGWHPYTYGRWVWTTDYGWYSDSDEDFGWATYHYGRWIYTVQYGWVWTPDDVWGPAWVDWRYSDDGYVGWAPMPPEHRWSGSTVVWVGADMSAPNYESGWVFVAQDRFVRGDVRAHRVPPAQNRAMLKATGRVTNYASVNGRIVNRSIDPVRLSAATKVRIAPTPIAAAPTLAARAGVRKGGAIPLYRPQAATGNLDLDVPSSAGIDTEMSVDDRVRALESNVDAGAAARGSVDAGVGAASRDALDAPVSGNVGGGLGGALGGGPVGGLGGAGGLRLGR